MIANGHCVNISISASFTMLIGCWQYLVVLQDNKNRSSVAREMLAADNKAFIGTSSVRLCLHGYMLLAVFVSSHSTGWLGVSS